MKGADELNAGIGQVVRRLRLKAGLTQDQLAAQSGITRTYVSQIEMGTENPTVRVLVSLGDALNVSPSELLKKAALVRA